MPWLVLVFETVLVIVMATIIGTSIKHAYSDWKTFHIAGKKRSNVSAHAQRQRHKKIREGKLDPAISRQLWQRKPQTQVVPNQKAENRRTHCRKQVEDGVFFC